jgi:hypothetical protein
MSSSGYNFVNFPATSSLRSSILLTILLSNTLTVHIGLGAFAASELDKVFSGYQPR